MQDNFNTPLLQEKPLLLALTKAFVILASLSLFACVLWLIWDARGARLNEARSASENLASALAQHAEDTLKTADAVLLGMAERLEVDGQDAGRLPRLQRFMRQRVEELPDLQSLIAFDRNGNWLTSSYGERLTDQDNTDRSYFNWHREHPSSLTHVSAPLPGRSSGEWVIPVTRRLNDKQGNFDGVVLAAVRVDYFQQFYQGLDLKYHGFISLSLNDGTVLVRQPSRVSTDLLSSALPPEQESGSFTQKESEHLRLYSFHRLKNYPLVVMTALTEDEVLTSWRAEALLQVMVAVILIVLLNLFGFYLLHLIKAELAIHHALQHARDHLTEQRQQLEKLALEDELTGLANRRHFMAHLQNELLRAIRSRLPISLLMLDVDWFKQYNDLYGHSGGDHCLREVARVLRTGQNRAGDLAARYGGEEFCVLLPAADAKGALQVAERIRASLEEHAITHAGSPLGVLTISIGVYSLFPVVGGAAKAAETLLQCSDHALYQAKREGRNKVVVYGQAETSKAADEQPV